MDIRCFVPVDTPTPSAARHEHCWSSGYGREYRLVFERQEYWRGWEIQWRFTNPTGLEWQADEADEMDIADELARLAGLTPPEER